MSKNHPHDNIYSILGKLEALKPTTQEKHDATVKQIYESVEAQGSILKGLREVSSVETRLARQFAESDFSKMSAAIQKTGKSKASADAITAAAGREKLGQKEMTRRSVAGRKDESYNPVKAVKQCAQQYMEMNGYTSVDQLEAEDIESIGGDCQMNYQDVCEILGCKLPDSLGPVKSYGPDEHGNIVDFEECTGCAMGECSVHGMAEGEFAGRSAKYGVCVVGHNGGKPVKMFDTEAEAEAYAKKGIRIDGKLLQGSVRTIVGEGEPTHKGGEKVATKLGTLHKSKATVDTEKELSRGDVPDLDADDSEPAVAKGRGRPKMDIKDRSQAKMPWGGKPPKDTYKHQKGSTVHKMSDRAPKGSPEYVGESMADAMIRLERKLLEGHMIDESGETLDHILNRFKHEVRNFKQTGELEYGSDLYDALYDYYCDSGEMPYGTAKARDGDPVEWISDNLQSHLDGGGLVGGNPPEDYGLEREGIEGNMPPVDNIPGKDDLLKGKGRSYYEEEVTMGDELNELARLAGLKVADEGNAFTGKLKATAKGDNFDLDGKEYTDTSTLDEEPNEGNAFSGAVAKAKADGVQPGEKIEVGGKTYPVKESMEECGDRVPEGDFNINTNMSGNGDKSVTVTATGDHAAELLQMLRIAGLGGGAKAHELEPHAQMHQEPIGIEIVDAPEEVEEEYGDAHVDTPSTAPVNAPKPEYKSMRASTMGPGEGDPGEKTMNPDRPTHNNGDNALATPPTRAQKTLISVSALESKFAAEYESIKKVS